MSEYIRKRKIDTNENKYLLGKYQKLFFCELLQYSICNLSNQSLWIPNSSPYCLPGPDIRLLILISGSKQANIVYIARPGLAWSIFQRVEIRNRNLGFAIYCNMHQHRCSFRFRKRKTKAKMRILLEDAA